MRVLVQKTLCVLPPIPNGVRALLTTYVVPQSLPPARRDKPPALAWQLDPRVTLGPQSHAESSAAQAHVVGATVTLVGLKTEKFNGLTGSPAS